MFALYGKFDPGVLGGVLETAFCSEAEAKYYLRKGKLEIDFLIMGNEKTFVPVEIKSTISQDDIVAYSSRRNKLGLTKGLILSMNSIFDEFHKDGIEVFVFPIWMFLLFPKEILKKFD